MVLLVHIMARSECFDIDSTLDSGIVIKDDMEQPTGSMGILVTRNRVQS